MVGVAGCYRKQWPDDPGIRTYVNKDQCFINVKEPNDILSLVGAMSEGAKAKAEKKTGLRSKIFHITNEQLGLSL